jgi:hypothetical protein
MLQSGQRVPSRTASLPSMQVALGQVCSSRTRKQSHEKPFFSRMYRMSCFVAGGDY